MRRLAPLTAGLAALLAAACSAPETRPAPSLDASSSGCEQPLGGEYEHADDPSYRYVVEDDGVRVRVRPLRVHSDGGVADWAAPPELLLERGPAGLTGETRAQVFGPGGQPCLALFETRAERCTANELVLLAASRAWVDASCQPAQRKEPARTQRLRKRLAVPPASGR